MAPQPVERAALQQTWREWFEGYDVLFVPGLADRGAAAKRHPELFLRRTMTVNGESGRTPTTSCGRA